jgi:AcrR family transcriptional regulator
MTLYGHFRTRAELVEAALADALRAGDEALSAVDLTGDAQEAMTRLLHSSWSLVGESMALLTAAEGTLPAERVRELHAAPAERIADLIRRGQDQGVFRTDLPLTWLVNVAHYVLHGAAQENRAERLKTEEIGRVVTATVQSILAAPSPKLPRSR